MKNSSCSHLQSLFWEATLRCNAYCEFCGSRCGDLPPDLLRQELTSEEICRCFREIAEACNPENVMINVTGGEALLRRDLFDIMSYASALGFPWGLVTNGSLIDETAVRKMKQSGMRTISISLDGTAGIHNAIRNIPDGFQKIREAVRLLKQADFLDELQITTVVNHKNIGELEPLYSILQDWGIDSWRIATVDPIGRADNQKQLLLTDGDLAKYFSFFHDHQFNGKITLLTSCSHYWGPFDNLYRAHSFACMTGRTIGSILANGDIYVCPNVPRIPELIQGNIRKDSFPEVWEKGFRWFRDPDRQKSGKCAQCDAYEACRGDSLHTWDFTRQEPMICFAERNCSTADSRAEESAKEKLRAFYPEMKGIRISYGNCSDANVVLTPSATKELLTYFAWGETSARNCFELLAGLVGYRTGNLTVVEHIVPGELEDRSEVTAAFSQRNYQGLLKEVSLLNRGRPLSHDKFKLSDHYSLVGIAHSHPLDLSASLSVPDIQLHGSLQREHTQFVSLLLNPQRRQIAAYYNSVFTPIDMELLVKNRNELESFQQEPGN